MNESSVNLGFSNRWSSFKRLQEIVHNVTFNNCTDLIFEFENLLKIHKNDFSSLLKNPPRNTVHKELVTNASKEGINVIQHQSQSKTIIPSMMVEEALILSEMFDLNELISLELIITGSNHEPRFPGMSRGPIAVLLYYDSKLSLLTTLKTLLQSSSGRTWSLKLSKDITAIIDSVIAEFGSNGISQCLDLLLKYDNNVQFDLLQKNQALGPGKYKKQVYNMIKDIHQLYADLVYSYAAQKDINDFCDVKKLIDVIATRSEIDSNGSLDAISTTLLMALLYTLDVSILQSCDENDPLVQILPVIKHRSLLDSILKAVASKEFAVQDLKCIINFAGAIAAKTLSLYPVNGQTITETQDEALVEDSIEKKVFEAFHKYLVSNPTMHCEEFFMRRIHTLISDFIAFMPLKLKELRDKGDEISRIIAAYVTEGIQPPSTLSRHFEKFLYFLAAFYANDKYNLANDIWMSVAENGQTLPKFISFHKFIRSMVDSFLPQMLHLPLLELLSSFAVKSPLSVYNLLKSSENHQNTQFSFNQFFAIFQNYYSGLRGGKDSATNLSIGSQLQRPFLNLTATEIDVLCGILKLISSIVKKDKTCCVALAENQRFNCISIFIGLLVCAIPRKLKAAILSTLGAFAKSTPSIALSIWIKMDAVFPKPQIAVTTVASTQQQRFWQSGIAVEIEDIEPRNEEYPITIAFLKTLNSLLFHINCNRQPHYQMSVESCLGFVINSIFLKSSSRIYKSEKEKWTVKYYCLKVIFQVLKDFDPLSDGPVKKGAFSVMSQVLQENILFRRMMEAVESVVSILEPDSMSSSTETHIALDIIKKSLSKVLEVFNLVAEKENDFLLAVHSIPGFPLAMLMKLASLFFDINPNSGVVDRIATLIRLLSLSSNIQISTLKFLQHLVSSEASVSQQILLQIQPFNKYHDDYFIHVFLECLESDDNILRIEALKFILITLKKDVSSFTSFGFSHRLLGFDQHKSNLRIPGPNGQMFTCLHAIIALIEACEELPQSNERCLAMQILHCLSKDSETSEVTLRFLRTSYDLITRYLDVLQKRQLQFPNSWLTANNISEISWFWRLMAIELKITTESHLKSHCNAYLKQLLGEKAKKKLTYLLPKEVFEHLHPDAPNWEYFDATQLWKTISECSSEPGDPIDVKLLHQKLITEIRVVGPQLGAAQTGVIQAEIHKILEFATSLNKSRDQLNEKLNYFESWRELTEVLLCVRCLDVFDVDVKARILLEMIQELLQHASNSETIDSLLTPISSVVLLSSTCLRNLNRDSAIKTNLLATAKTITNLLESSSSAALWQKHKRARVNLYGTLLHIYRILPQHLFSEIKLTFRILEKLCKDVLSGHEITKVLAISVLNETDPSWIREVVNDGTLHLIINSLLVDEKEVKTEKFDEQCKAFYSFESKMTLLMKIASTSNGSQLLLQLGIVDVLSSLETFEIYPFLFGQSDICFKMFASILRLLISLCTGLKKQNMDQMVPFITARSAVMNDILRSSVSVDSEESVTILKLMSAFLSQLIIHSNSSLQKTFLCLINTFTDKIELKKCQILLNVLNGYVQLTQRNSLLPLFAPSWNVQSTFVNIGQPFLGILVSLIDNSLENIGKSVEFNAIVELSLYLLWHHLNLYFTLLANAEKDQNDVNKLQMEAVGFVSDVFFSRIQNTIQTNDFVEALIRRIKTIILLRS